MSARGHANVHPCESSLGVADGHGEQAVRILPVYVIALGVGDISLSGALHAEMDTINGAHLAPPEASPAGCAELRLEHLELLNIVDGEVHVVEVLVDRVDHMPDTAHDHGFGHAIDEHEVLGIAACEVPERGGKPSWQLHRLTAATVASQLLVGHCKGGRQDGEELVE